MLPAGRLTILVSGMMAGHSYQGGATWAVLQYLLGFRRLGHRVHFVESVSPPALRPGGSSLASSTNAGFFSDVVKAFGLEGTAALLLEGTRETVGMPYDAIRAVARESVVLINLSGLLTDAELTSRQQVRVYVDLDPAFTQLWHAVEGLDVRFGNHTHFVTVGQSIGSGGCAVPTCGIRWITTLQPVVLEEWPRAAAVSWPALTTVANWRSYGSIEHEGVFYGQKAHSLRRFVDLPGKTRERFVLAMGIHPRETADLDALAAHGWTLLDPGEVAATPASYRSFVQGSKAEFGIAKSGYVASRCGWFGDRSICYLASGRPVIAQETGFSRYLPTGLGLLAFETADDVVAGIETLNGAYERHAAAARALAEAYFDSDAVLTRLLDSVGGSA